jgi:RNA polymerase sigma-54 factor
MLKPSLQLRLGQQLTMTPQLQQAIRLLQLPVLDLQAEIHAALETNLMLEAEEPSTAEELEQALGPEAPGESEDKGATGEELEVEYAEISTLGQSGGTTLPDDLRGNQDYPDTGGDALRDHLTWQLEMERFEPAERTIGRALIDSLNDDGYLVVALEEIPEILRPDVEVTPDEVGRVLAKMQSFDPPGCFARDLAECLLIQLGQLDPETPGLAGARRIADRHLELVAENQRAVLKRQLGLDDDALDDALLLLRSLNPRPGASMPSGVPEYIIPDVFVRKHEGKWIVEANPGIAPRIRVNQDYARLVSRQRDYEALRAQLQEARWLVKSLEIRNDTLLRVARTIVDRQQDFLDEGDVAMKPLILRDVAEAVGMHESTISRATTSKYMHTPRGLFEFRYFFSSQVANEEGDGVSSTAIRAHIRQLIASEEAGKPLSDSAIAKRLSDEGIKVARRTVAKYRESMGFPSSSERRRVAAR